MLLCAPSLGILDNWLPVLHAARASHPEWRIVAVVPDRETLAQIDPNDTAHVLADDLIDLTIAPLVDGGWVIGSGFAALRHLAAPSPVAAAVCAALRGRSTRLHRLLRPLRTSEQRARSTEPSAIIGADTRVLYDIHLHDKPRLAALLASFSGHPHFSHHHGLELEEAGQQRVAPPRPADVRGVFVYGPSEVDAYVQNFGLRPGVVHPVGIVRHTPDWVRTVVDRSERLHRLPFPEFLFIVSRPAGSPYLPRDRKIAALRTLHRVAWEDHRLPLVLRTHPKEHEDGTIAEALPASGEGVSWMRSRAHPFHLAQNSRLAVTFFSGVSIDLVALGVPVVELLDVRGLHPFDAPDAPRDARGRPRFGPYRRDGLVLPAEDADGLHETFDRITTDREAVVTQLQTALRSRFSNAPDALARILEILSA